MKISVKTLKESFVRIINKLENSDIDILELDSDLYRFIPTDSWSDFTKDEILIGSIDDDIMELNALVVDKERFCTFVDFDRVAFVLRAISEEQNSV